MTGAARVLGLAIVLGAAVAAAESPPAAAPAAAVPDIRWVGERVTVKATGLSRSAVLGEVAKLIGATVKGGIADNGEVTLQFESLPLDDALTRILGDQNFTIAYAAGKPKEIALWGGPLAPLPPTPALTEAEQTRRAQLPPRLGFPRSFRSKRQIPLPDALQAKLGTESTTFDEVFDVATGDESGITRAEASMVVLSTLERDRHLRRQVLSAVGRLDDATLAQFGGTPEGERMEQFLEFLSVHSREKSLQYKAGIALDRYRSATGAVAQG